MFSGYRQSRSRKQAAIPDPGPSIASLQDTVLSLKLAVEALLGQRGDEDECAVTWGDLVKAGVIDAAQVPTDVGQKRR